MATLFISDLHIDAARPAINAQFLQFLETEARSADALYILGDLFESWIGDDAPDSAQSAAIRGLRTLTDNGVPCFVMHGNRDFLLSRQFCDLSGAHLLPDPLIVTLYGEPVLVMHGDALCTDDRAYQRLRATVRDADWQRQFLALSIDSRLALAGAARAGSQAHTAAMEHAITDVNADSVAMAFRAAGTSTLLHGHTHRPAIHALEVDGRPCTRIVLGDWYDQGSVLRWDHLGPQLQSLSRGGPE
ncbi:MAG TPA: UDP-2,3-diacylglucosamine diphosphatase [Steroidobacteraceae bacterium]|nr:UDP-2,3-diacylglucosamine diphosphatase [Steroidobacteraceae bacterium]